MSADKEPMSATRRALFSGVAGVLPAVAVSASPGPCAAAEAYRAFRTKWDAFNARRGVTDEELRAFCDEIASYRQAIWDTPCDSKGAAIAKLQHLHDEMLGEIELNGDQLVAQVLRWMETV